MPIETHYSVLKVSRSASTAEIKAAYRAILLANHPDKTQHLAPFALLSDPVKAAEYDAEVRTWDSFDSGDAWKVPRDSMPFGAPSPERGFPPHRSNTGSSDDAGEDGDDTGTGAEGNTSSPPSSTDGAPNHAPQAEYRYGLARTATDIDIKLKGSSLYLLISTKFRFLNTVTAHPTANDTKTIAFELHLERNKSYRPIGTEFFAWRNPELIIGVDEIPGGGKDVSRIQTVFKEVTKDALSLTISITAISLAKQNSTPATVPWKFGFDFDMKGHPAAWGRKRGTCMIFTPDKLETADPPEEVLKREKGFMANAFCGLLDEKLTGVEYKGVRMWRVVAVGYGTGTFLQG